MQRGRVLSLKNFKAIEYFKRNYILFIILFFLLIGIFFGVFRFDDTKNLENIFKAYIEDYILSRTNGSFGKAFLSVLLSSFSVLFLLFLLGGSLFGVVTLPIAMFVKGFFQGGVAAYMYSQYGLKGIAFNAVIYIPSTILFLMIMLLASGESVKFSFKISNLTLSRAIPQNLSTEFKDYSAKFIIFAVLTVVSSLIDAAITTGLIKNFSFV